MRLLQLLFCISVWIAVPNAESQTNLEGSAITFSEDREVIKGNPGLWGEIESYYTFLEPPLETIDLITIPSEQTEWHFFDMSLLQLDAFLGSAGVTPQQHSALMDPSRIFSNGEHHRLFPTPEVITTLSSASRNTIYRVLGQWEENPFHHKPFFIENPNLSQWFYGTGLETSQLQSIARLVYGSSNSGLLFSDLPYLLRDIESGSEEKKLLTALCRVRTLVPRIRISDSDNFENIARYWTSGYRNKDILPVMESVIKTEGVEMLDIAHLLPPTPRKHLFTFPGTNEGVSGRYPDWLWTSINFFNFIPLSRYADSTSGTEYFHKNYVPIPAPEQFGDLILVRKESNGEFLHGCIYIADDIVYTKNSASLFSPWVLSRIKNLIPLFSRFGKLEVIAYRLEVDAP